MERLDLDAFEANVAAFDARVEAEPTIDGFCSGSAWILPYHAAFLPDRELHLYREGEGDDERFVALAAQRHPTVGPYLEPLEQMWQYACPCVGPGSGELLARVARSVAHEHGMDAITLLLSGIPIEGELTRSLLRALAQSHTVRLADTTFRFVASLEGGLDGWLSRRSPSFRRNLRAAGRRVRAAGVEFVHLHVPSAEAAAGLYRRILAVEQRSWKAQSGNGADSGPMRVFYERMHPRLAASGRLRVLVARKDGRDIGYLHGGALGQHFRGLQVSFDSAFSDLSLGNCLQLEMIQTLCGDGFRTYDLGSQSGYKARWAEEGLRTATLVCRPRR